ncbi:MAG: hypothetical protein A4E60_00859 [Syntrophorhabdus sp. PtaB.Bin047]|nr:MAG: hypothetical protein A4E60_00859 [Syntrophorhabdus sp. PtaB.Bin047]
MMPTLLELISILLSFVLSAKASSFLMRSSTAFLLGLTWAGTMTYFGASFGSRPRGILDSTLLPVWTSESA